jgi:nicotinamide-nucleotide adenylyltransferase|tara:strand:+ start:3342 stop:3959 length:618 start_codon:yes stop_codon:yes gene_type:complete
LTELTLTPPPPNNLIHQAVIVLGRFQPFHKGHISLINKAESWRMENSPKSKLILAIGSSNRPETMDNPWSYQEREEMIKSWINNQDGYVDVMIVPIPDIEDPPNWVSHAEKYHGKGGVFFTSDEYSADLYKKSNWKVIISPLTEREKFEGWRVRATAHMMSTISDIEAIRTVLSPSVHIDVINYLIRINGLRRLAFLGQGGEPVG